MAASTLTTTDAMMTVGSLFAGIGGLDLGFERAGFEVIWQCERDDFCTKILNKHWPNVPVYDDVQTFYTDDATRGPDYARSSREGSGGDDCTTAVCKEEGNSGRLNPRWTAWLMGFPIGWTALED